MPETVNRPAAPAVPRMALADMRLDGGTQPRAGLHEETVEQYTAWLQEHPEGDMPPVVVFDDGQDYWLADGFHRHMAYTRARRETLPVDLRQGLRRDALAHALGANTRHGLRRSREDVWRAVRIALEDPEWGHWSNLQIARLCATSDDTVARVRASLSPSESETAATAAPAIPTPAPAAVSPAAGSADGVASPAPAPTATADAAPDPTTRTYRDKTGKINTMRTGRIGRSRGKAAPPGPAAAKVPVPRDAVGLAIPDPLKPVFAGKQLFGRALQLQRELAAILEEIALAPGGTAMLAHLERHPHEHGVSYRSPELQALKAHLKASEPYAALCPRCHRSSIELSTPCPICRDRGWVSLSGWEACSEEDRQAVEEQATAEAKKEARRSKKK